MATVTIGGKGYTTDSSGYITNGPAGSLGLNIKSISGYNPAATSAVNPVPSIVLMANKPQTTTPSIMPLANSSPYTKANPSTIEDFQGLYNEAKSRGDTVGMNSAHSGAEAIRANQGYSGGVDGSQYLPLNSMSQKSGNYNSAPNIPEVSINTDINSIMQKIQEQNNQRLQQLMSLIPQAPQTVDYSSSLIPSAGVAATANPGNTTFIPTANFRNRQLQTQQAQADQNYKAYTSELANWNAQAELLQNAANQELQSLLGLLPYSQLTAAQQAEADLAKATASLKQNNTSYDQAMGRWNAAGTILNQADADVLGVPVGTSTNDASYRAATLDINQQKADTAAAKKGGSKSGSLGSKPLTDTQVKGKGSELYSSMISTHKRPVDAYARIKRDMESGAIDGRVGTAALTMLQKNYPTKEAMLKTVSSWK